jgi:hypothetical protein
MLTLYTNQWGRHLATISPVIYDMDYNIFSDKPPGEITKNVDYV